MIPNRSSTESKMTQYDLLILNGVCIYIKKEDKYIKLLNS